MRLFELTVVNLACNCFRARSVLKTSKQKTKFSFPQGTTLLRRIGLTRKLILREDIQEEDPKQ